MTANSMKRLLIGAGVALAAQGAMPGIVGTPHDLSGRGWGTTEVCIFCHAPHNTGGTTPLWNHALTTATYTLYASQTLNATLGQPSAAGSVSRLCLSCHDGTVAIDAYGSRTGTTNMSGGALLGTNLGNDHPIAFTYDAALATSDGGLVSPASASHVVPGIPLFASKMECSSCHNAHDNTRGDFLRVSNTASALCLKCHVK